MVHDRGTEEPRPARRLKNRTRGVDVAVVLAANLLSQPLLLIGQVLVARALDLNEYGRFSLLLSIGSMLSVLAAAGVGPTAIRLIPRLTSGDVPSAEIGMFVRFSATTIAAATALTIAPYTLIFFRAGLGSAGLLTWTLGAAMIPLLSLTVVAEGYLQGLKRFRFASTIVRIAQPAIFCATAAVVLLVGDGKTLDIALVVRTLSYLLLIPILWGAVRRRMPRAHPSYPRELYRLKAKEWRKLSLSFLGFSAIGVAYLQVDTLIVGLLSSHEDVGLIAVAARLSGVVGIVLTAVIYVSSPLVSQLHASGDRAGLHALVQRGVRWTAVLATGAGVAVVAGAPLLLGLFGPEYARDGRLTLIVLVVAQVISAVTGPSAMLLNMTEHQRTSLIILGLAFGVNVVADMVLIPPYGVEGAAFGSLIAVVVQNGLMSAAALRLSGVPPFPVPRSWSP